MVTFLFWNLNGEQLETSVSRLAHRHDVDVLILAECDIEPAVLLRAMNKPDGSLYQRAFVVSKGIEILTRFAPRLLEHLDNGPRWTIRRLRLPARIEIILVAAHMISKLHWSADSQRDECNRLAEQIREVEARVGNDRTLLVGDLNMNPFESGVVSAKGLNAAMARQIAEKRSRTVQQEVYPFFYNPMWGHFGDRDDSAPGTYYYDSHEHVVYYWNMFDQVLVRPGLLGHFRNQDLRIVTTDGTRSLLSRAGVPDGSTASDHLPILFTLQI